MFEFIISVLKKLLHLIVLKVGLNWNFFPKNGKTSIFLHFYDCKINILDIFQHFLSLHFI